MILALWFVVISNVDYGQLRIDTFMLTKHPPIGPMLDEYATRRGNYNDTGLDWLYVIIFSSFSMLVMVVTEITIYIIFFHHMYKHDNGNILRRVYLNPASQDVEIKQTCDQFFGQFCSFILRLLWMSILLYIYVKNILEVEDSNEPTLGAILIILILSILFMSCVEVSRKGSFLFHFFIENFTAFHSKGESICVCMIT